MSAEWLRKQEAGMAAVGESDPMWSEIVSSFHRLGKEKNEWRHDCLLFMTPNEAVFSVHFS